MNILIITSVLAFTIFAEAQKREKFEKPYLICEWQGNWLKSMTDNRTEKKSKTLPTEAPSREITGIYQWNDKLSYLVNLQIRLELIAFYNYLHMSRFFHKYDQDREGFAKYFRRAASEELEHAEKFMQYQQMRGGDITMWNLPPPKEESWSNGRDVLISAYVLEKNVTDEIMCLHKLATDKFHDTDFLNFLEDKIIPEQYESMKEIKTHIKNLDRACPGSTSGGDCATYPLYELQYDEKLKEGK